MKFDKSKVYSIMNADEVKVGSRVLCSDTLEELKGIVESDLLGDLFSDSGIVSDIHREDCTYRFKVRKGEEVADYALVYLLEEPDFNLQEVLLKHQHWLSEDVEGWRRMKAHLDELNLAAVDLRQANLTRVSAYGTTFRNADLSEALLANADLRYADLSGVNLYGADLRGADLREANLHGANLASANLSDAKLDSADLTNTNMRATVLRGADLIGVVGLPYIPMVCPEEGEFIGWKKGDRGVVIKLLIPADARRSSATTRKCRCDKAKVLGFYDLNGEELREVKEAGSLWDPSFKYRKGEMVAVENFDYNRWEACSTGIHFFMQKQEAIIYK